MCYPSPVMLRVPQHHPGRKRRGRRSCAISERPTPSFFALPSLFRMLSLTIPAHPRHSPVSPIIPAHTQNRGWGGAAVISIVTYPQYVGAPTISSIHARRSQSLRISLILPTLHNGFHFAGLQRVDHLRINVVHGHGIGHV